VKAFLAAIAGGIGAVCGLALVGLAQAGDRRPAAVLLCVTAVCVFCLGAWVSQEN
jgi:hypothetical protein